VRIGGYIIADNVLWSGKVVEEKKDKDTLPYTNYKPEGKQRQPRRKTSFCL